MNKKISINSLLIICVYLVPSLAWANFYSFTETVSLNITAQDIGSYKPNLANFRYMFDRLAERGIERGNILHVAQSLHHDIEPARELGLACVWIDRRHAKRGFGATVPPTAEVRADLVFPSLDAFAAAAR